MKVKPYDNGVFILPGFLNRTCDFVQYLWENSESQVAFMTSLDDFQVKCGD